MMSGLAMLVPLLNLYCLVTVRGRVRVIDTVLHIQKFMVTIVMVVAVNLCIYENRGYRQIKLYKNLVVANSRSGLLTRFQTVSIQSRLGQIWTCHERSRFYKLDTCKNRHKKQYPAKLLVIKQIFADLTESNHKVIKKKSEYKWTRDIHFLFLNTPGNWFLGI